MPWLCAEVAFSFCGVCAKLASVGSVVASDKGATKLEVGTTVLVKGKVTGTPAPTSGSSRQAFVFIATNPEDGGEGASGIEPRRQHEVALGPDAELLLDEYAVPTGSDTKTIALILKGTFRFLTGSTASESYKIDTPSATIGIRGTILEDIYIDPRHTFVLLHKGEVEIAPGRGEGRPAPRSARASGPTVSGSVSQPMK